MSPKGNTLYRLDKYGYRDHYNDGNNYQELPEENCSFYLLTEPDFFPGWIEWPYLPDNENIIPAKYRWDSHDPQWGYEQVLYTINQGWDEYSYLCGPPNYKFSNKTWEGETSEYLAMKQITISSSEMVQNNNLIFHADDKVILNPGTIIYHNNNHILFKAGDVCVGKQNTVLMYSAYETVNFGDFSLSNNINKSSENNIEAEQNVTKLLIK